MGIPEALPIVWFCYSKPAAYPPSRRQESTPLHHPPKECCPPSCVRHPNDIRLQSAGLVPMTRDHDLHPRGGHPGERKQWDNRVSVSPSHPLKGGPSGLKRNRHQGSKHAPSLELLLLLRFTATDLFHCSFTDLLWSSILESDTKVSCIPAEEETGARAHACTQPRNQGRSGLPHRSLCFLSQKRLPAL